MQLQGSAVEEAFDEANDDATKRSRRHRLVEEAINKAETLVGADRSHWAAKLRGAASVRLPVVPTIMLSHAGLQTKEHVLRVRGRLHQAGYGDGAVFVDAEMAGGVDAAQHVVHAAAMCRVLVVTVTRDFVTRDSGWPLFELFIGLARLQLQEKASQQLRQM